MRVDHVEPTCRPTFSQSRYYRADIVQFDLKESLDSFMETPTVNIKK